MEKKEEPKQYNIIIIKINHNAMKYYIFENGIFDFLTHFHNQFLFLFKKKTEKKERKKERSKSTKKILNLLFHPKFDSILNRAIRILIVTVVLMRFAFSAFFFSFSLLFAWWCLN